MFSSPSSERSGTYAGIQLAHAGRKASTYAPWVKPTSETAPFVAEPGKSEGWENVWGPSGVPYSSRYPVPHEMTLEDIEELKVKWKEGVERSIKAGFDVIEVSGRPRMICRLRELMHEPIAGTCSSWLPLAQLPLAHF
jgi:2,4-dienoyl-CoA reductase-like NADH-dependent reductase (Old Yellow Enzyme family)